MLHFMMEARHHIKCSETFVGRKGSDVLVTINVSHDLGKRAKTQQWWVSQREVVRVTAGLGFGPWGPREGPKRETEAPISLRDPTILGAGLNGSLCCLGEAPGVADPAGSELTAVSPAHKRVGAGAAAICTSVPAQPLWQLSFVSTKFSHKNIFRKYSQFIEL